MKFSALAVLSVPLLVSAQYGPDPAPATSSAPAASSPAAVPSAGPGQHIVQVGTGSSFTFSPNSITASANEIITFVFNQPAGIMHSITQSSFAAPCTPLQGGFDSGLVGSNTQWNLTVTDASKPIWFYCKQTNPLKHCGMGMVGGINVAPGSPNTVDAFINAAKAIGTNEGPQTASGGLTGVGAAATAPPSSATAIAPAASGSSAAGQLTAGAGFLMASVFAVFALA